MTQRRKVALPLLAHEGSRLGVFGRSRLLDRGWHSPAQSRVIDDSSGRATACALLAGARASGARPEHGVCNVEHLAARTVGDDDEAPVLLLDSEAGKGVSTVHVERADAGAWPVCHTRRFCTKGIG